MANVLCRDSKYLDNFSLMGMFHMDGLGMGQKWKVKPNYCQAIAYIAVWALPGSLDAPGNRGRLVNSARHS
jgi:hypothetical protein